MNNRERRLLMINRISGAVFQLSYRQNLGAYEFLLNRKSRMDDAVPELSSGWTYL